MYAHLIFQALGVGKCGYEGSAHLKLGSNSSIYGRYLFHADGESVTRSSHVQRVNLKDLSCSRGCLVISTLTLAKFPKWHRPITSRKPFAHLSLACQLLSLSHLARHSLHLLSPLRGCPHQPGHQYYQSFQFSTPFSDKLQRLFDCHGYALKLCNTYKQDGKF